MPDQRFDDGRGSPTGRGDAVGAWRDAFIGVQLGVDTSLGLVADTFETAITWDRWPDFDATVREGMADVLRDVFGEHHSLSCRFTHVYPDGPAPYYTWSGVGLPGSEISMWSDIKAASNAVVVDAGGTVTHHHAVGRMHRPDGYDRQRPELFADALRAVKKTLGPNAILNPGVLSDAWHHRMFIVGFADPGRDEPNSTSAATTVASLTCGADRARWNGRGPGRNRSVSVCHEGSLLHEERIMRCRDTSS